MRVRLCVCSWAQILKHPPNHSDIQIFGMFENKNNNNDHCNKKYISMKIIIIIIREKCSTQRQAVGKSRQMMFVTAPAFSLGCVFYFSFLSGVC